MRLITGTKSSVLSVTMDVSFVRAAQWGMSHPAGRGLREGLVSRRGDPSRNTNGGYIPQEALQTRSSIPRHEYIPGALSLVRSVSRRDG
jgi:hypothetical protein